MILIYKNPVLITYLYPNILDLQYAQSLLDFYSQQSKFMILSINQEKTHSYPSLKSLKSLRFQAMVSFDRFANTFKFAYDT